MRRINFMVKTVRRQLDITKANEVITRMIRLVRINRAGHVESIGPRMYDALPIKLRSYGLHNCAFEWITLLQEVSR